MNAGVPEILSCWPHCGYREDRIGIKAVKNAVELIQTGASGLCDAVWASSSSPPCHVMVAE